MKRLILVFFALPVLLTPLAANEAAPAAHASAAAAAEDSPLTAAERALEFDPAFLRVEDGTPHLDLHGEPLTVGRILSLSPWDLMEVVQALAHTEWPLSRFGNGDALTQAWRAQVAAFVAAAAAPAHHAAEDLFDPGLVLWDPGYLQQKNEWGQWMVRLAHRDIVQGDLATLSPLEVQQAVEVLTGRTYAIEFVLEHLEAFRLQLSVVPRLVEASAAHH